MEINTPRLLMRELAANDLSAFHRLQSDPQVTKYTKQGPNKTLDRSRQMLDSMLGAFNATDANSDRPEPLLCFAITRVAPHDTDMIGYVGTFRPREVGFALHPDFWGRGYAQEAVKGFCTWYLDHNPGQQLFAKVNLENEASVKCLERCGFSRASEDERRGDEAYGKDASRETWLLRSGSQ